MIAQITGLFTRYPRLAGISGLIFALVFAALAVTSYQEIKRLPNEPQRLSISDATALAPVGYANRPWVTIENSVVDCQSIRYRQVGNSERTQVILTDSGESILVVAEFSGRLACSDIIRERPTGLLSLLSAPAGSRAAPYLHG